MEWIMDNWFVVFALLALLLAIVWAVYAFLGLPTPTQVKKIKEWLLWAVVLAEAELGKETGVLKLRMVYDMFIERFPLAAKVVSFETFKKWVDEALDQMREILLKNEAVAAFVEPVVE